MSISMLTNSQHSTGWALGGAPTGKQRMQCRATARPGRSRSRPTAATGTSVVAVAELMDITQQRTNAVTATIPLSPGQKARSPSPSRSSSPPRPTTILSRKEHNIASRHPLSVRVAQSSCYDRPDALLLAMQGSSHSCLVVGRSQNLSLCGNYSINGPAVITKREGRLIAEIKAGGILSSWLQDEELSHMEEVFGDEQGRLVCGLNGEHVEVCGNLLLDDSIPTISHHHKRVLSVSSMHDGDSVELLQGGNLSHPVSVQPQCDHCTCGGVPARVV